MNVFYLDSDPKICAEHHCDKHVVKMIIEYGQLMSTAHRVLDGKEYIDLTANNRKIKRWLLPDSREDILMKASHINHPSGVWARQSDSNYTWLCQMWYALCKEYTYRYGKIHSVETRLVDTIFRLPNNISEGVFTEPTPAMPDDCKIVNDSLASYHKYYNEKKTRFARWTKRATPNWYVPV